MIFLVGMMLGERKYGEKASKNDLLSVVICMTSICIK